VLDAAISCIVPAALFLLFCVIVWAALRTGAVPAGFVNTPAQTQGKATP